MRTTFSREEFTDHGLDDIIQIKHQNVYRDGFEVMDEVDSGQSPVPSSAELELTSFRSLPRRPGTLGGDRSCKECTTSEPDSENSESVTLTHPESRPAERRAVADLLL